MNEFRTVYETTVLQAVISPIGLAALIGLAVLYVLIFRRDGLAVEMKFVMSVFVVLWLGVTVPILYRDVESALGSRRMLQTNQFTVAEGTVKVLREEPPEGHAHGDCIRVGDTEFVIDYSDRSRGPRYFDTIAHGGALRDGVYARICHYYGVILRVELKP